MAELVNQGKLALLLGFSRQTIIAWEREGCPVAQRGGRGRQTLYDVAMVRAWCAVTGRGYTRQAIDSDGPRASLSAPAARPDVRTDAVTDEDELALQNYPALELALLSLPALMTRHGVAAEAARLVLAGVLEAFTRELEVRAAPDPQAERAVFEEMLEEERLRPGTWTTD